MKREFWTGFPRLDVGFSSVILGAIGLLLFILPVLSLPICGAGIVVGLGGILAFSVSGDISLRACVAGLLLSASGLGVACAIHYAPTGYFPPRSVYPVLKQVDARLYIPPPAPPRSAP